MRGLTRVPGMAVLSVGMMLTGCSTPYTAPVPVAAISSVTPSSTGVPNSVASLYPYEFVTVQGPGQIFTYNVSGGAQVQVGMPYKTPCSDPSGMVVTSVGGVNVMAVVCYDTGQLLTLSVGASGSLSALGAVSGLAAPFPGIALDGTNVLVPLYGSGGANGGVAKVSIAAPATPVITGTVMLASPASGGATNTGYVAVAGGMIYVAGGSESAPQTTSSNIQVVNEATMTLVGTPLVVAHSPQKIAVNGSTAYVTFYDASQLESIDLTNPAAISPVEILYLTSTGATCNSIPAIVQKNVLYVGCYAQGTVDVFDVSTASAMRLTQTITGVAAPQSFSFADQYLLVAGGVTGGNVYEINPVLP